MSSEQPKAELAKKAAAKRAAELIESGMLVGLGTGSTAAFFISFLAKRYREGLNISCIATSTQSAEQAKKEGLPLYSIDDMQSIDITVDGADEIDSQKRMIKGAGGALVREKIIASSSREMIVIVDERKVVKQLGGIPLPVEIIPFAHKATISKLEALGYSGKLRMGLSGTVYTTDNNNYIYDIPLKSSHHSLEEMDFMIQSIPGVVDTGFFFNLAGRVIVGYFDGQTKIIP